MTTRPPRRIGLTKGAFAGPSLHSSINGVRKADKPIKDHRVQSIHNAPTLDLDNAENIYACPRSSESADSGDEEATDNGGFPEQKASSCSEDELGSLITKGNIKKTRFRPGTRHQSARNSSSQSRRGTHHADDIAASRKLEAGEALDHGTTSSSIKTGLSKSPTADWVLHSSQPGRSKKRTVYGSSQRSDRNKPSSSSQSKGPSPKKTFKVPDISVDDDYPTSPEKRLRIASSPSDESSPAKSSQKSKRRRSFSGSPAALPEKAFTVPTFDFEDDEDKPFVVPKTRTLSDSSEGNLSEPSQHPLPRTNSKKKRAVKEEEAESQMKPAFHMDSFVEELLAADDVADNACTIPPKHSAANLEQAEAGQDSSVEGSLDEEALEETKPSSMKCPMCGQLVDKSFFDLFSRGKKLSITSQTRFHHAHLRQTAKKEHAKRGFPEIDWSSLPSRLLKHRDLVSSILSGRTTSHYRDALSAHIASGRSRTLRQGIFAGAGADSTDKANDSRTSAELGVQSLIPGYYGSRGLRAISEWVMDQFSDELRRMAVRDRIVGKRGVTEYVQTVLVRELVCMLIMEDMNVDLEEARVLLLSSAEVGELVNEEIVEVVERTVGMSDWM